MTLERAIELSAHYHAGQKEKNGDPYLLHPLRVMLALHSEDERVAAILHDIVEDTGCTFEILESEGLSGDAFEAVRLLTKDNAIEYESYIRAIAAHSVATRVKLADLADNLNQSRLPKITKKDLARFDKYRWAKSLLELADNQAKQS